LRVPARIDWTVRLPDVAPEDEILLVYETPAAERAAQVAEAVTGRWRGGGRGHGDPPRTCHR
jgi:hypothetical protein